MTKNEGVPSVQIWIISSVKQKFAEQFVATKGSRIRRIFRL